MLRSLSIKNIAVIENVNIDFLNGFNVLTGETGAGKSIIIDSINLLKGERAQKNIIRHGETKARVDGVFDVTDEKAEFLRDLLGIDIEDEVLISREISVDGKGSVRINGVPVTLSMLKVAGDSLINIHGQHDNTSLLSKKTHITFLDKYASDEISDIKNSYEKLHRECLDIKNELDSIDTDEKENAKRLELLKYQIEEIEMSDLKIGEDDELCERKTILENSYKIASGTSRAYASLYEGSDMGQSAYDALWTAIKAIEPIARYDKALDDAYDALCGASDVISESARFFKNYLDDVESTGEELDKIESRLEEIHTLKLKYAPSIELILSKKEEMEKEVQSIAYSDERLTELEKRLEECKNKRAAAAEVLTNIRKKYAKVLCDSVTQSLEDLCMPSVSFDTQFKECEFRLDGKDDVEFLICTNKGEGLKPLTEIASGGELSRIMLAIKGVLADCEGEKLLIFDEVDTGVSGAAAQSIGEKLWHTSKYSQVICITHLPQIAAIADNHYLIEKHTDDNRTRTSVRLIDCKERTEEVARTLGGASITDAAIKNARELIELAQCFKNGGQMR